MSGMLTDPVHINDLLNSKNVQAGDTIILLPGDYVADKAGAISGSDAPGKGVFRIPFRGTKEKPVTIKAREGARIIGGLELVNSPYITLEGLYIAPVMDGEVPAPKPTYPVGVYCNSVGCRLLHSTIIGGLEGVSWFGVSESEIYGNYLHGAGWHDGNKWRGAEIYTHNHYGGRVSIRHNIFGTSKGAVSVGLWSAGINNVLDYDVRENAFTGNGVEIASYRGRVSNVTFANNHMWGGSLRLGQSDQDQEQDRLIEGNIICRPMYSTLWLYYQTQVTYRNNKLIVKQKSNGAIINNYPSVRPSLNKWEGNEYYNPEGAPFYQPLNSDGTWEEWVAQTGETGTMTAGLPKDETFEYPDLYGPGKLVCTWKYGEVIPLTVNRGS